MGRTGIIDRKTKETDISITLELDGTGKAEISTGIGFFDHMLEGFARHGFLTCSAKSMVICRWTDIIRWRIAELYWDKPLPKP